MIPVDRHAGHVDPVPTFRLLDQIIAIAHGWTALEIDGFLTTARMPGDDRATTATTGPTALLRAISPR